MDRRIFGVETEFGISYSGPNSRPLSPEEVARYLFRKVVSWGRSSNVFLTNGSENKTYSGLIGSAGRKKAIDDVDCS